MRVSQAYLSTEQSSVANYKFTLIAITRETIKLYLTQHCAADFVPNFYRGLYIPPRSPFININKLLNHQGGEINTTPRHRSPPLAVVGGGFYFIISRFLDTVNPLLYIFFTSRLTRTMEILYLTFYFFYYSIISFYIYIDIYIYKNFLVFFFF